MTAPDENLLAAAAHGLLGSRRAFSADPPKDHDYPALLSSWTTHRLLGLAASAVSVGQLHLSDSQADRLHTAHAEAMCVCLHLEATLLDVQGAFASAGVDCRVIKGPVSYTHLTLPTKRIV